ncbi:Oligoxyloglucan reducing end-specific cellobiohydrolase [Polyplosphaeria fusca]|uniref:Oligoxyloglucan reducing end-specific cellobiohydrolase n=1 Tax=Polyplosphaeria fusca TaxID=682080 RepID=A0A9P4QKQ3_9PLEO|nr:Oligoxyloglucan reducing end-specific cellobiohydrolase [Polyplosphaeria fusca]
MGFALSLCSAVAVLLLPQTVVGHPNVDHQLRSSDLSWKLRPTHNTQQFRGLAPISSEIAWVSGTNGTVLRTCDGGTSWTDLSPPLSPENATNFEFRDIQAWNSKHAVVLSIGEGNLSRIFATHDGGNSWEATFVNDEEEAFYDCMAFENKRHGLAMSDPVNGKFRLVETWDGGSSWAIVSDAGMAAALKGEFGFAASGTCIEAAAGRWYIASGGVDPGRIFFSSDGHDWDVANSSIVGGEAAGVFSVRFRDAKHGIAVGGDYTKPNGTGDNAAWSQDGGRSWVKSKSFPSGYRSGVSWIHVEKQAAVAVGTSGSDVTFDGGKSWHTFDNGTFDAVECVDGASTRTTSITLSPMAPSGQIFSTWRPPTALSSSCHSSFVRSIPDTIAIIVTSNAALQNGQPASGKTSSLIKSTEYAGFMASRI